MTTDPTTIPSVSDLQKTKKYMDDINEFVASDNNSFTDTDSVNRRTVTGINNDVDEAINEFNDNGELAISQFEISADIAIDALKSSQGFEVKGTFANGFTYGKFNDVGQDDDGNPWVYIGSNTLPVSVSPGTDPTEFPLLYSQRGYNDHAALANRNQDNAHLSSAITNDDGRTSQNTHDALKANLVAQGLSGKFGFFTDGFTYNQAGDVGIDSNGDSYTYVGSNTLPVSVSPGTDPLLSYDFSLVKNLKANFSKKIKGGQILKLKEDLTNSLVQKIGVVFCGDSITWGMSLATNDPITPRGGVLSDVRNNAQSPSFVNLVRNEIHNNYFQGFNVTYSNYPTSPSGQSIATYRKNELLFPILNGDIDYSLDGVGTNYYENNSYAIGAQLNFNGNSTVDYDRTASIKFKFTGEKFNLVFTVLDASSAKYEVIVNGVSIGIFNATSVTAGVPDITYGGRIEHQIPFTVNAEVEIKAFGLSDLNTTGTNWRLPVEAIEIPREISISNQGIIGVPVSGFTDRIVQGISEHEIHCIVQLGTNDRYQVRTPHLKSGFKDDYKQLIASLAGKNIILMCPPPADQVVLDPMDLTIEDISAAIDEISNSYDIDLIDNYRLLNHIDNDLILADGTHPNNIGHRLIADNIIAAIGDTVTVYEFESFPPKAADDGSVGDGDVLREAAYNIGVGQRNDYSGDSVSSFYNNGAYTGYSTDPNGFTPTSIVFSGTFGILGSAQIAIDRTQDIIAFRSNTGSAAFRPWVELRTTANTTVDTNGFVKEASPIIKLFSDKIELNNQCVGEIKFQKIDIGHYIISGTDGFAVSGWYIETPKDANGVAKVFVEYEYSNGLIEIKCFDKENHEPVDVPEGRWIDLRIENNKGGLNQ